MTSMLSLPKEDAVPHSTVRLSDLNPGEAGSVARVEARGPIRQRLLEMGFVRGERLEVVKVAPLGDPMEIVIKGYHLSLRREESVCILVVREEP